MFQFDTDSDNNLTVKLSADGLLSLIEQLERLRDSPYQDTHAHIESYNGLAGNVRSVLIMKETRTENP